MRISFIGAGRVAHHLAHALKQQHQIVNIFSQGHVHAQQLADAVGAAAVQSFTELSADIDLLLIAVSDSAIAQVIQAVHPQLPDTLIAHTSGSTDITKLAEAHSRAGVFYPLQTFSLERGIDWGSTPVFTEAAAPADLELLTELADSLGETQTPRNTSFAGKAKRFWADILGGDADNPKETA